MCSYIRCSLSLTPRRRFFSGMFVLLSHPSRRTGIRTGASSGSGRGETLSDAAMRSSRRVRATMRTLRGGLGRSGVVMDVSLLVVLAVLVFLAVVVAMGERGVVVLVGVPERAMFELPRDHAHAAAVMM